MLSSRHSHEKSALTGALRKLGPFRLSPPELVLFFFFWGFVLPSRCAKTTPQEESQLTDALQRRRLVNPHLKTLHAELSASDKEGTLDAFGLFM